MSFNHYQFYLKCLFIFLSVCLGEFSIFVMCTLICNLFHIADFFLLSFCFSLCMFYQYYLVVFKLTHNFSHYLYIYMFWMHDGILWQMVPFWMKWENKMIVHSTNAIIYLVIQILYFDQKTKSLYAWVLWYISNNFLTNKFCLTGYFRVVYLVIWKTISIKVCFSRIFLHMSWKSIISSSLNRNSIEITQLPN